MTVCLRLKEVNWSQIVTDSLLSNNHNLIRSVINYCPKTICVVSRKWSNLAVELSAQLKTLCLPIMHLLYHSAMDADTWIF